MCAPPRFCTQLWALQRYFCLFVIFSGLKSTTLKPIYWFWANGALLICFLAISSVVVGQTHPPHTTEDGIACQECINEMHRFGQLIHDGREVMASYLAENYCPTLAEHAEDCPDNLAAHYPDMVNAVVDR